ncbi:hypothetical protein J5X84_35250 [Streptosporangiaceae bacterium NEAU-GS5]|nr:hypothetical protein [Streptosporangiaceae bacterium NEAU-GS5]
MTSSAHAALLERLAALPPARREALRRALGPPDEVDAAMNAGPLSSGQERLWFLQRYDPGDSSYSICWALGLHGPVDPQGLAAALTAVVARHEILRTRFRLVGDRPVQVVLPPGPVAFEQRADLAGLTEFAERPFDLANEPPLRGALARHAADHYTLCLVIHHIAVDGWSLDTLMREFTECYAAHREGRAPGLEPPAAQYRDYVAWERGRDTTAHLAYWTDRLAGTPALDLPGDRPRPARWSGHGGKVELALPPRDLARLDKVARAGRVTFFMALLAAYQATLGRAAGQPDFCVGVPVVGAGRTEFPGLLGYLSNTIALRVDLRGDPTFTELLGRTRVSTLAALQHSEAPYEAVLGALRLPRDLSRPPLCQAMFNLTHNLPKADLLRTTMADLSVEILGSLAEGRTKADVSVDAHRGPEGLTGAFEYNSDLFTAATGARLARAFTDTVNAAAADPERRLSQLGGTQQ